MAQPLPDIRKYQLFPKDQSTASSVKALAPEEAFARAMGQNNNSEKAEKFTTSGSLRFRLKDHNPSVQARRRKVSVPELGPMTTVHESSMDSPTIPGRQVLHERSASVPSSHWRQFNVTPKIPYANRPEFNNAQTSLPPKSPNDLPPLTIPSQMTTPVFLQRQLSSSRLKGISTQEATQFARPEESPRFRTPYTPLSATPSISTTPGSATTAFSSSMSTSTLPTPVSSVPSWRKDSVTPISDIPETPTPTFEHRRNVSDSSSIMDRGRPKKSISEGVKRSESRSNKSAERLAFETLPKGWKVPDAVNMLDASEAAALNKQALQQAARFEILRKSDVDTLSRELRHLDERCEYLRRTYHSLRAGRRNLHSRICSYLRSPRMVKFSQESLLKQEEALAELDNSIDDWVNKLEQAENRRTRVRQKLLEHVAAAVTLPGAGDAAALAATLLGQELKSSNVPTGPSTPPRSPLTKHTPQGGSASPLQRPVVAQVPSTIIEQPIVEEAASIGLGIAPAAANEPATVAGIRRAEVESIRIYAGDEVAALLADVEQEITRMSLAGERNAAAREKDAVLLHVQRSAGELMAPATMSDQEHREVHRARSAEALQAGVNEAQAIAGLNIVGAAVSNDKVTSSAATPVREEKKEEGLFMLSAAVFNPKAAMVH